jgi:hypothetical protein
MQHLTIAVARQLAHAVYQLDTRRVDLVKCCIISQYPGASPIR